MNRKMQRNKEKSRVKSKELIATLSQLESAIHKWENSTDEHTTSQEENLNNTAPKIAQALLKQLRQQIDELSD